MIVKMKQYEKEAIDYAQKRFPNKTGYWSEHIMVKDAFLLGLLRAIEIAEELTGQPLMNYLTEQEVEVEFKDGDHQL